MSFPGYLTRCIPLSTSRFAAFSLVPLNVSSTTVINGGPSMNPTGQVAFISITSTSSRERFPLRVMEKRES